MQTRICFLASACLVNNVYNSRVHLCPLPCSRPKVQEAQTSLRFSLFSKLYKPLMCLEFFLMQKNCGFSFSNRYHLVYLEERFLILCGIPFLYECQVWSTEKVSFTRMILPLSSIWNTQTAIMSSHGT